MVSIRNGCIVAWVSSNAIIIDGSITTHNIHYHYFHNYSGKMQEPNTMLPYDYYNGATVIAITAATASAIYVEEKSGGMAQNRKKFAVFWVEMLLCLCHSG